MTMPKKFDPALRERTVRMLAEAIPEHKNKTAAVVHVAGLLGLSPETLRTWARRVEIDAGRVPGVTSEVLEENRRLKRENAELRKANEVLKAASVFFAKELDRPWTR
jgi:transposase